MTSTNIITPHVVVITIKISITYRNHYPSKYTPYQEYLYNRIRSLREDFITPKKWSEIRKLLTSEGLKTPLGKEFGNNNVQSIYIKGKKRLERLNFGVKVEKSLHVEEYKGDEVRTFN